MAVAYGTIANDGIYIEPTFYTEVRDSDNNIVISSKQETGRAFSETTAYIAKDILTEPVTGASGTARRCWIKGMDVGAKTGTSNQDKDRWLCGFTNYYTASVWYGYDDPEQVIAGGVSPATLIWADAMKKIHEGLEASKFKAPSNVVTATICRESGKLASETCTNTYAEIFEKGTIPQSCEGHVGYKVCEETGLLANEYCTKTKTVHKTYLIQKEKLGLWTTWANTQENTIPDKTCEKHTKPVEPEKPEEPEEDPEKPTTGNKPSTDKENNTTGGNTGANTSTNTNTKPNTNTNTKPNTNTNTDTNTNTKPNTNTNTNTNANANTNTNTSTNTNKNTSAGTNNDGGVGGAGDEAPPVNIPTSGETNKNAQTSGNKTNQNTNTTQTNTKQPVANNLAGSNTTKENNQNKN